MVDPAVFDPIMDLHRNDSKLLCQVGDPPLVLLQDVLLKQFTGKSQSANQIPDAPFGELTATPGRYESLAIQCIGDLKVMEAFRMKITNAFRHLSIVLELLEAVDRTRDLMFSLHSSLPHDRHFIQFWRAISDQNHTFHNAPHDLFAINRRCAFGVPDLRDTFRERADAMPLVRVEGRRLLRQKTIVFLFRFKAFSQRASSVRATSRFSGSGS